MDFELPKLKYSFQDLAEFVGAETMEIHYSKHHQAYISNLNASLETHPELKNKSIEKLLSNLDSLPADIQTSVRNNGGGHFNHSLFWSLLTPNSQVPSSKFSAIIDENFDSMENFKDLFKKAALSRFGSGWVWLVENNGKYEITSTSNQDSPIMEGKKAILGLDVWEHAYYLKFQNRRAEYVDNFWNFVNFEFIDQLL